MASSTIFMGLDVGYGNLKCVFGPANASSPQTYIRPVGAAPERSAEKDFSMNTVLNGGRRVLIDGNSWVAGVDPRHLQSFIRPTHEDYTSTDEYMALVHAALAETGAASVQCLVTGLPVSQYFGDPEGTGIRKRLADRLRKEHFASTAGKVTVESVLVVPQPSGSLMDAATSNPTIVTNGDSKTVVLDVGYGTADWVVSRGLQIRNEGCGSSTHATFSILSNAASQISLSIGSSVDVTKLESAMRTGAHEIMVRGRTVDIRPFVEAAAAAVAPSVLNAVKTSLRSEPGGVDSIILTGGGVSLFAVPTARAFPGITAITCKDPVTANARGFFEIAKRRRASTLAA